MYLKLLSYFLISMFGFWGDWGNMSPSSLQFQFSYSFEFEKNVFGVKSLVKLKCLLLYSIAFPRSTNTEVQCILKNEGGSMEENIGCCYIVNLQSCFW